MCYHIFLSPQVKRSTITNDNHGIYALPHKPPKGKSKNLRKLGKVRKISKTRVRLRHPVNDCLWKQAFASNLRQTPSNLISFTIFVTLRSVTKF